VKGSGLYPRVLADTRGSGVVSQGGGLALVETVRASGVDTALSAGLARWRKPMAVHHPGKVICDLAVALALGGDCLADIALLRAEPAVFGRVASDPTVSRTIDGDRRRSRGGPLAGVAARGEHAPDYGIDADTPLIIDTDATLITAHSDKEQAAPTFKRGFGFHPLWSFADHGSEGTGEPLSFLLRAGNAGSNTAADHIAVVRAALAQLPGRTARTRPGRKILIRAEPPEPRTSSCTG
jgi:Transposase DDE domain group 1